LIIEDLFDAAPGDYITINETFDGPHLLHEGGLAAGVRNQVAGAFVIEPTNVKETHEHPLDHPDRRPRARSAWLFRPRPLLGIGLGHA
jgi:hypothetical protein